MPQPRAFRALTTTAYSANEPVRPVIVVEVPVITSDPPGSHVVQVSPRSREYRTEYAVIGEPPVSDGAVHETVS